MLREAIDHGCVVVDQLEYAYGLTDGHGWPTKSSQSVPRSGCRATPFCLMNPRIEYIWVIFRRRHHRSVVRTQVVAFLLVVAQKHRTKVAHSGARLP
jgi:hypothetical protein